MPCVRPIKYTYWPLLWSSDINVAHGAMPSRKWAIQPVKTNIVENSIPYLDRTKNRTHFPCGLHKFLSVILFSHSLCLLVEHEIFVCVCVRFCTGASNHSVQCFYWLHFTLPPVHYGFCCGDEVKEKNRVVHITAAIIITLTVLILHGRTEACSIKPPNGSISDL